MRKDLSLLAAAATVAAFLSAGPSAVVAANGPRRQPLPVDWPALFI